VYAGFPHPPLKIECNHVKQEPTNWDCVPGEDAFECSADGNPVFQLVRESPSHFEINGIFPASQAPDDFKPPAIYYFASPNGLTLWGAIT
jgi:hypothetical protein